MKAAHKIQASEPISNARAAFDALSKLGSEERALGSARFFKTGPGDYGEGDKFLGVSVPLTRTVARSCDLSTREVTKLLKSEWHEARLLALFCLVRLYKRASSDDRRSLYDLYLAHSKYVNNWDLVDSSAEQIIGPQITAKTMPVLRKLARSTLLWDRRIAMIATFHHIKLGDPAPAFEIALLLLKDREDLIHKAVGWMIREAGKRCGEQVMREFLDMHAHEMPRTALRYAIEHLPKELQRSYREKRS